MADEQHSEEVGRWRAKRRAALVCEVTGYEFALRGRAKEAERALEEACLVRFGTLRPDGATPVVRSDNGLIFQSLRFRAACRDYGCTRSSSLPLHASKTESSSFFSQPKGGMRLAAQLRRFRRSPSCYYQVD
jgi:transposase InsO family protein